MLFWLAFALLTDSSFVTKVSSGVGLWYRIVFARCRFGLAALLLTFDVALNNSLGICGLIAALLVLVAEDAGETIGMFDLSGLLIDRVVGMLGVATISIGVTSLAMVVGVVTLTGVLTAGVTTVEARIPDAFKGLLLLRGVCFVRGDDAFGEAALTGVVDEGVSIVRGTVSFVSFDGSEEVFGFGGVCVGVEAIIDISGGVISIPVEIIDGETIGLSTASMTSFCDCGNCSVNFLGVSIVGLALAWLFR